MKQACFYLKQEKETNTDILCKKTREQLRRKEKQYHKEEVKQEEVTHRTLEMDARTSKNNLTQVS